MMHDSAATAVSVLFSLDPDRLCASRAKSCKRASRKLHMIVMSELLRPLKRALPYIYGLVNVDKNKHIGSLSDALHHISDI